MANHKVIIVKKQGSRKPARVTNPHLVVAPGDHVTFIAKNTEVVIFFPEKNIFKKGATFLNTVELDSTNNYKERLLVDASAPTDNEHDYAIWVEADGEFADVGSYPSVIID